MKNNMLQRRDRLCLVRRGACLVLGVLVIAPLHLVAQQTASPQRDTTEPPLSVSFVNAKKDVLDIQDYKCFTSEYGSIFSNDTAWARKATVALSESSQRFTKLLGKRAGRVLVIYPGSQPSQVALKAAARNASCRGEVSVMWAPQMTVETYQKMLVSDFKKRDSLVNVFRGVMPALSPAQLRDSAELQLSDSRETFWENVYLLAHEVGHLWLLDNYPKLGMSYATGKPGSWLFEAASVLMEDSRLNRMRRRELIQSYRSDQSGGTPRRVHPLEKLFVLPHQGSSSYYAQVRGVLDFMLERTRDPAVFSMVAESEGYGNFGEWLQSNGARFSLPTTIEDLEKEWQQWLARVAATGLGYVS